MALSFYARTCATRGPLLEAEDDLRLWLKIAFFIRREMEN